MKLILILAVLSLLSGCALFKSRGVYQNCNKVENQEKEFACDRPIIGR